MRDFAAFDKGILILAGPMQDVGGTYSVYRWDGAAAAPKLWSICRFHRRKKQAVEARALLPLIATPAACGFWCCWTAPKREKRPQFAFLIRDPPYIFSCPWRARIRLAEPS